MRHAFLAALLLSGCVVEPAADAPEVPPCDENCVSLDFGTWVVPAAHEEANLCWSFTLNNPEPLWVNTVAMQNDGWFHHSNWFWVPETSYVMPDGPWDCGLGGFTELGAAIVGSAFYAQTTQVLSEEQSFLPGAATQIAPRARIITASHILNVSQEAAETGLRMQLHTLPEAEVEHRLEPFRFTYFDLDIPAGSKTAHAGTCDLATEYEAIFGEPMDMKIHYALPHLHGLGDLFRLEVAGGEHDGQLIMEQEDLYGEASGITMAEPIDLAGADGLRFDCGHDNQTDADVGWGIGDQEMCVMLGFAETRMRFDGTVGTTETRGEDGERLTRSGSCDVRGFAAP
jgi:hypothetical protein